MGHIQEDVLPAEVFRALKTGVGVSHAEMGVKHLGITGAASGVALEEPL